MNNESDFDIEAEFKNLSKRSRALKAHMVEINKQLKDRDFIDENREDMTGALKKVIDGQSNGYPLNEVEKYISSAHQLAGQFENFNKAYGEKNFFEVSKQRALREAERTDIWKLWRDKIARWVVGVLAAVILYSCLVYVSEESGFIKIPVRDFIFQGK